MIEKITTIFICEYCNKPSLSKGAMVVHERSCKSNPTNKSRCFNCKHNLGTYEIGYCTSEYIDDNDSCFTGYLCAKRPKEVLVPIKFWRSNSWRLDLIVNQCDKLVQPMPFYGDDSTCQEND